MISSLFRRIWSTNVLTPPKTLEVFQVGVPGFVRHRPAGPAGPARPRTAEDAQQSDRFAPLATLALADHPGRRRRWWMSKRSRPHQRMQRSEKDEPRPPKDDRTSEERVGPFLHGIESDRIREVGFFSNS